MVQAPDRRMELNSKYPTAEPGIQKVKLKIASSYYSIILSHMSTAKGSINENIQNTLIHLLPHCLRVS